MHELGQNGKSASDRRTFLKKGMAASAVAVGAGLLHTGTAAFAEELAKQLPVKAIYEDAGKPAAQQLGQLAQDLVKVT